MQEQHEILVSERSEVVLVARCGGEAFALPFDGTDHVLVAADAREAELTERSMRAGGVRMPVQWVPCSVGKLHSMGWPLVRVVNGETFQTLQAVPDALAALQLATGGAC